MTTLIKSKNELNDGSITAVYSFLDGSGLHVEIIEQGQPTAALVRVCKADTVISTSTNPDDIAEMQSHLDATLFTESVELAVRYQAATELAKTLGHVIVLDEEDGGSDD